MNNVKEEAMLRRLLEELKKSVVEDSDSNGFKVYDLVRDEGCSDEEISEIIGIPEEDAEAWVEASIEAPEFLQKLYINAFMDYKRAEVEDLLGIKCKFYVHSVRNGREKYSGLHERFTDTLDLCEGADIDEMDSVTIEMAPVAYHRIGSGLKPNIINGAPKVVLVDVSLKGEDND